MKYRDPVTGEFKDIVVKAGDTLPIGTVVEYEGTEIPDGYVEVEDENTIVKVKPSDIINLNSGFSFLSDNVYPMYKQGKHYWGYAVISSTGNFSNSQSLVGSFKVDVSGTTNSYCILSSNEWSSTNIGYLYYTKSAIYIADHNNAGKNVAKVFLDFVIN